MATITSSALATIDEFIVLGNLNYACERHIHQKTVTPRTYDIPKLELLDSRSKDDAEKMCCAIESRKIFIVYYNNNIHRSTYAEYWSFQLSFTLRRIEFVVIYDHEFSARV